MNDVSKFHYTWKMLDDDIDRLVLLLKREPEQGMILSIGRGGWIPGVMLSHRLNWPIIPARAYGYSEDNTVKPDCPVEIYGSIPLGRTIYVVDDLIETGLTLDAVKAAIENWSNAAKRVTLINKGEPGRVEFTARTLDPNKWIIFPWEN